jgi:phage/plasmid-like protein (TIGR03299 family)
MSAELDYTTGKAAIAYTGEVPWHGEGEKLPLDASLETWIEKSGMGFKIVKSRARYYTEKGEDGNGAGLMPFPDRVALFRHDAPHIGLGIVSDTFQTVQPRETVEFIYDLCQHAGITMSTAGALFDGRRFWAMCDIGAEAQILDPKDKLKAHLMMSTACDGSRATEWRYCTVRTVCNNTLQMNLRHAAKIKITHRSKIDHAAVRKALGIQDAISTFERTIAEMIELAQKPVKESGAIALTAKLLHDDFADLDGDKKAKILRSKPIAAIGRLALDKGAATGSELDGSYGTAWGWLNAVTEYVDHSAGRSNTTFDNRIDSAYFGKGAELKQRAYELAQSYTPSLDDIIASANAVFVKPSTDGELVDSVVADSIL